MPVPVDIDDAPEYYIWTVSEGAMDYDIYEEKVQGKTSQLLQKVKVAVGEFEATFDLDANYNFEAFIKLLNEYAVKREPKLQQDPESNSV